MFVQEERGREREIECIFFVIFLFSYMEFLWSFFLVEHLISCQVLRFIQYFSFHSISLAFFLSFSFLFATVYSSISFSFITLCHCLFVHLSLSHSLETSMKRVNVLSMSSFFLYLAFDCWSLLSLSKEMEPIWFLEKKRSWYIYKKKNCYE